MPGEFNGQKCLAATVHVVTKQRVGYDWVTVSLSFFLSFFLFFFKCLGEEPGVLQSMVSQRLGHKWLSDVRLCNPMHCNTPHFPVLHHLTELAQTYAYWLRNASNYLILCCTILILASVLPRNRIFSNESILRIRWPKHWSFSFSICHSNKYAGLISFRIDWFDLLIVQGTLKSLLQPHSSKASIL